MHPPFARGVTHLMYVGDSDPIQQQEAARASVMTSPIFWLGAAAIAGGAIGMTKKQRKVAGALAVLTFLAL
jgi:hypothetical protein